MSDEPLGISPEVATLLDRIAREQELRAEMDAALIEALPFAKILIDEAGAIVRVNVAAEVMFGYSRKELLGQPLEILVPDDLREKHVTHRATYIKDTRMRPMGFGLNAHGRRRSGEQFPINVMLSPFVISTGRHVLAIVRPVVPELTLPHLVEQTAKTEDDQLTKNDES